MCPFCSELQRLSGDLLSHVLAQIRLTGDRVYSRALPEAQAADLDPASAYVLIVTAGTLTLSSADEQAPLAVEAGDLLLLPHGSGDLTLSAAGGAANFIICRFWFDPDSLRVMVFALPRWIHVRRQIKATPQAGWAV
jgi:hypothetical protein